MTRLRYNPVTAAAKKLLEDALALPEEDRCRLARALMESVSSESTEGVEEAWRATVLKRIDEVRRGDVKTEPWSEVKQHIRDALNG
ncbi:MAG: addiction module protein [Proteobacteria bacterium]|nr:addiction module protein [Pseudomonadota bacterium]